MSNRSMGAGFGSKALGWISVFCLVAASDPGSKLFGFLDMSEPWTWSYAIPWTIAGLFFAGLATVAAKRKVVDRQQEENSQATKSESDFMLMLRPFAADGDIIISNPDYSEQSRL